MRNLVANPLANLRLAPQYAMTSIGLYSLTRYRSTNVSSRLYNSALLGNYYEFFYAVEMCFKSNNMLFVRLGYCVAIPAFI